MPWFLSGEPDVLALLDEQVEATVTGMRAVRRVDEVGQR